MSRLLHTLAFLFCLCALNAQTVWLGSVDDDWTNTANWSAGVPTSGSVVTLPASPAGGNFPTFSGSSSIDFTIQNAGILTFNSFVYNNGQIVNFGGGQIINNDQMVNGGGKLIDNDGHFENNGILDNYGTIDIAASGSLDNENAASVKNFNSFLSFGPVVNNGATFDNHGTMVIVVAFENNTNFNNFGIFESQFGSVLSNGASASIVNKPSGEFSTNGSFTNANTLLNEGELIIQNAGQSTNNGSITNANMLEIAGTLINENSLVNNSELMINSAGRLENNATVENNSTITIEICGILVQNAGNTIAGNVQSDGIIYEINGSVNETNGEFGLVFTDINETPAPVPACKRDVILQIDESGVVNFTAADVDQGRSYGSCGASLESITITPTSFTSADVGVQIVTLTVTDNFGNSSSCEDFVTVLPFSPPIVPNDDPDIDFACPEDITVSTQAGAQFAPANWSIGEAATTCAPVGGGIPCSTVPSSIPGFTYLGEYNENRYFVSNATASWTQANINAQANGGQLVTINDAAENAFITNNVNPSSGSVWIGYNNVDNGSTFQWASGENNTYTNWQSGEPNGSANTHAARLRQVSGEWTDRDVSVHFEYVIEIACYEDVPDCAAISNTIPGTIYLGEFNNSKYYCTETNNFTWHQAKAWAESKGGHLVIIDDQAENDFVQSVILADFGWIGLTDELNEGTYVWVDGQQRPYFNWNSGEPNNSGGNEDYIRLLAHNGKWTDRNEFFYAEGIMEIPCPASGPVCNPEGSITREAWYNIGGGVAVALVPVNSTPDETENIGIFEAPVNIADNYGTRIRGYIFPPATGTYTFWLASDDNGELWISTDDNPANKQLIATVPTWTSSRQWNKFPEQQATVTLQAGQRYYIEALAKEQAGGDNLAVGWQLPDGTLNRPISGSYLSPIGS
ncbi:MAG: lectin-like protein, partial [Bacteroidota bacterium]